MSTAVVFNGLLQGSLSEDVPGIRAAVELIKKFEKLLKNKEALFVLVRDQDVRKLDPLIKGCKVLKVSDTKAGDIFQTIYSQLKGYIDVIFLSIDTPLIDIDVTEKMLRLHRNELAEYTYGEGFPVGITPEILRLDLFPKLASILKNEDIEIERDSIFKTLSREINSFDVETYFAPRDLKLMRLELSTTLKRNALLVQRVVEEKGIHCSYEQLAALIDDHPGIVRTIPSYIEVELTNRSNGTYAYSPLPYIEREEGSMTLDNFKVLLEILKSFCESFYIACSLWGEPLLHEDVRALIEYTLSFEGVELIVETDGVLFTPDFTDYISGLAADNFHLIFEIDAVKEATYKNIRNGDLNKVERNIRYLLSKVERNVYVQMVRTNENEQEMLSFFETWEKEKAGVIIQKYNSFLGLLPNVAEYDLRPLERMPCWHLLRDMVIFHNGDVPRCKQDINAEFLLGNIFKEEVTDIWGRGAPHYLSHCGRVYDRQCRKCDEYFTFNF
jgi:spiro-SPASM protein